MSRKYDHVFVPLNFVVLPMNDGFTNHFISIITEYVRQVRIIPVKVLVVLIMKRLLSLTMLSIT